MSRSKRKCRDISIIIPAAGLGRRMKSYGPKSLIEVGGSETILSRQLRILRSAYPRADIVLVVGYEGERVLRTLPFGIKVVENELYAETNVARSIAMGLRVASHSNVLVVYGDLVFNAEAISWTVQDGSSILIDRRGQMGDDEVGVTVVDGRATNMSYGLPIKWGHIAYLTGRELELFKHSVWQIAARRSFGFEVLNQVIDKGGRLRVVEPVGCRLAEVDTSRDIERALRVTGVMA